MSAGTSHTCARLSDGTARCWGLNTNGRLGDGTTIQRSTPTTVLTAASTPLDGVSAISSGRTHTCAALDTGTVRCWGNNAAGQLGTGNTATIAYASTNAIGLTTGTAVAAGGNHTITLPASPTLIATASASGVNTNGQLGDNTTTRRTNPVLTRL